MKIKAKIGPPTSKYYGTVIELTNEDDGRTAFFTVWINSLTNYDPSEREASLGEDGKYYVHAHEYTYEYEICDDHYETQGAYQICEAIVKALDGLEVDQEHGGK